MSELHQCPFVSRENWNKKSSSNHSTVHVLSPIQNPGGCPSNQTTAWLIGLTGSHLGEDFRLTEGEMYLGSGWDSEIVVTTPEVSRKHVKLVTVNGVTVIHDNGSATGVLINGESIREPKTLAHNDKIKIGVGEFLFFSARPKNSAPFIDNVTQKIFAKAVFPLVGWLICESGDYKGLDFRLCSGLNRVGSLPGIEVALPDQNVNSIHMTLECSFERIYLRPGFANMSVIRSGIPLLQPGRLQDGDVFKIGALDMVLRCLA